MNRKAPADRNEAIAGYFSEMVTGVRSPEDSASLLRLTPTAPRAGAMGVVRE